MIRPEEMIRLRHMLDYSKEAVEIMAEKKRSDLDDSRILQLATVRLIEIVGEASARLSKDAQSAFPKISWVQISGMRNRLVHGYDFVDLDILWQTVKEDLPELIKELQKIVPLKNS